MLSGASISRLQRGRLACSLKCACTKPGLQKYNTRVQGSQQCASLKARRGSKHFYFFSSFYLYFCIYFSLFFWVKPVCVFKKLFADIEKFHVYFKKYPYTCIKECPLCFKKSSQNSKNFMTFLKVLIINHDFLKKFMKCTNLFVQFCKNVHTIKKIRKMYKLVCTI